MQTNNNSNSNKQVERSQKWILEALFLLLDKKPYNKITITAITTKAGVARQTFYRNYRDKDDIINVYLQSIFQDFLTYVTNASKTGATNVDLNTALFELIMRNEVNIKKIIQADMGHLLLDQFQATVAFLNDKQTEGYSNENQLVLSYSYLFQISGIVAVLGKWIQQDMPFTPEEMGRIVNQFLAPFEEADHSIFTMLGDE